MRQQREQQLRSGERHLEDYSELLRKAVRKRSVVRLKEGRNELHEPQRRGTLHVPQLPLHPMLLLEEGLQ
jgi:hypothetical protein